MYLWMLQVTMSCYRVSYSTLKQHVALSRAGWRKTYITTRTTLSHWRKFALHSFYFNNINFVQSLRLTNYIHSISALIPFSSLTYIRTNECNAIRTSLRTTVHNDVPSSSKVSRQQHTNRQWIGTRATDHRYSDKSNCKLWHWLWVIGCTENTEE